MIDSDLSETAVWDCFHLGTYSSNSSWPWLVLVNLTGLSMLSTFYQNNHYILVAQLTIKPDLPPERCDTDKILLSERWKLIQPGVLRTQIKIRDHPLTKLHGKITYMQFIKSQASSPSPINAAVVSRPPMESEDDLPKKSTIEDPSTWLQVEDLKVCHSNAQSSNSNMSKIIDC